MDWNGRMREFASSLLLFAPALVFSQAPKKIAVYPFDDRANTNKSFNIGMKVADALVAKLAETGSVTIVDRQYLAQIAAEKKLKYDSEFDRAGRRAVACSALSMRLWWGRSTRSMRVCPSCKRATYSRSGRKRPAKLPLKSRPG